MSTTPGDGIDQLITRIGLDLQRLEDHLKLNGDRKCKVRFPRGFIRPAKHFRERWWFIRGSALQRNVAYALIQSDVYRWLLNRTDLWGTAREMIIKEGICLIGSVVESVTKDAMTGICGKHMPYEKRMQKMADMGIINADLQKQLCVLWKFRNREHLFLLADWEHGQYELAHYNAAIRILRALRDRLDKHFAALSTPF